MILLTNGKVYLEKGDTVPVKCPCGVLYVPRVNSEESQCPTCKRFNDHNDETLHFKRVKFPWKNRKPDA